MAGAFEAVGVVMFQAWNERDAVRDSTERLFLAPQTRPQALRTGRTQASRHTRTNAIYRLKMLVKHQRWPLSTTRKRAREAPGLTPRERTPHAATRRHCMQWHHRIGRAGVLAHGRRRKLTL